MFGAQVESDERLLAWEMRNSAILRQVQIEQPRLFIEYQQQQQQKIIQQKIYHQLLWEEESTRLQQQYIQQRILQQRIYQNMLGQKAQPNVHNRLPEQQTQELPQKDELKQSQTQPKQPQNHKLSDDKTENQAEKRSQSQQQQHKQRKRRKTAQQQTKDRVSLPKLRRSLRPRPRPQRDEQVAKKMRIDRKNNSEFAAKSKSKDSFLQEDGVDGEASLGKISLEDGYWIDDLIQEGVLKKQLMDAKGDYPVVAIQEESLVDGYWV